MKSLLLIVFVASVVGLVISIVLLYKLLFAKKSKIQ